MLSAILALTSYSIYTGRSDVMHSIMESYVNCMVGGNREGHDCHMLRLDLEAETIPELEVIFLISIGFLNFASLPLVVEFQTIQKSVRRASKKLKLTTKL